MAKLARQFAVSLVLLLSSQAPFAGVFDGKPIEVKDLQFGEVLFHFYQNQYFTAIVKLMAAKELDLLPNHSEEVDALLAGFYLNYGLHQEAERELRKMADKGVPVDIRNRAWIKLGQARYQKGLYDDAIRALEEVERPIPPDIDDEIQLQMGNLLIARGDYAEAIKRLEKFPRGSDNALFAQFNLGIALFKNKRQILGAEQLDLVGISSGRNKEVKALKDKANIALGYALLMNDDSTKAKAYFQRVRVKGPFSNKALLGLGWANVMQERFEEALTPWTELLGREKTDVSVYEAMLAVPFALEQLKDFEQSLASYNKAIETFTGEIEHLDGTISIIRNGRLWDKLLDNTNIVNGSANIDLKFIPKEIEQRYISSVVATHAFHETVRNLQDLRFLQDNLKAWSTSIPAYSDMLELRKQAFKQRLPELLPDEGIYKLTALKDEAALYREEMNRIEQQNDMSALATKKEQDLIDRLDNMKGFLVRKKHLLEKDDAENYQEKFRLYAGLLEWDIGSTIAPRRWKLKRELRLLDKEIEKAGLQAKKLQRAKGIAPRGFQGYDAQIKRYSKLISKLTKKVDDLYNLQKETMERLIIAELNYLKQQIAGYLDQARFAAARLKDSASNAGGG